MNAHPLFALLTGPRILTPHQRIGRARTQRLNATIMALRPIQDHKTNTEFTTSIPSLSANLTKVLSSIQSTASIGRTGKVRKHSQKYRWIRKLRSKVPRKMRMRVREIEEPFQDNEPLKLGQRVILRSQVPVPVQQLVTLHMMYQKYEVRANKLLNSMMRGEPTREYNTALRCAVREIFEE